MALKTRSDKKKASVFRRFWHWLTHSSNRGGGIQNGNPDKEAPSPEGTQKTVEYPYTGRLYKRLEEHNTPLCAGDVSADAGDLQVYEYCGVVFPKADIVYHYICAEEKIQVGDRVLVPVRVHGEHKQAVGIVVSVGQYLAHCVPRPLQQTKYIIEKL